MHLELLIGTVVLLVARLEAGRRLGGDRPALLVVFLTGVVAMLVATTGPVHDLAEQSLFTAHMVQHLLLVLVVAPCLLAGTPAPALDRLLDPMLRLPVVGWLVRTAPRPVPALALYSAALVAWHLPGPFQAALEADAWHAVEHVTLTGTAILAWWPAVSPSRRLPALPYGARILYLFVFGFPMTIVAAMVTGADHVLYPFYERAPRITGLTAFEDQRLGGILMWVPAGLVPLVAFTVVFFRWVHAEWTDGEEFSIASGD